MFIVLYFSISVGCMEDGTSLGDVELPPWAKNDSQEFIRIQREVSDLEHTEAVRHRDLSYKT